MVYDTPGYGVQYAHGLATKPGKQDAAYSYAFSNRQRCNTTQVTVPGRQRNYNYDVTGTVSKVTDEMDRYFEVTDAQAADYARTATLTPNAAMG